MVLFFHVFYLATATAALQLTTLGVNFSCLNFYASPSRCKLGQTLGSFSSLYLQSYLWQKEQTTRPLVQRSDAVRCSDGRWWPAPGCRNDQTKCIPVLTVNGWLLQAIMQWSLGWCWKWNRGTFRSSKLTLASHALHIHGMRAPSPKRTHGIRRVLGLNEVCDIFVDMDGQQKPIKNWVVVLKIFYFHLYLAKWSNLTNIFQGGWNHQPEKGVTQLFTPFFSMTSGWRPIISQQQLRIPTRLSLGWLSNRRSIQLIQWMCRFALQKPFLFSKHADCIPHTCLECRIWRDFFVKRCWVIMNYDQHL